MPKAVLRGIMVGDEVRAEMSRNRPIMMVGISLILTAALSALDDDRQASAAPDGECPTSIRSVTAPGGDQ